MNEWMNGMNEWMSKWENESVKTPRAAPTNILGRGKFVSFCHALIPRQNCSGEHSRLKSHVGPGEPFISPQILAGGKFSGELGFVEEYPCD